MTADRETWFRILEPPPGGAERLRQRLEEEAGGSAAMRPPARFAIAAAVTAAFAVAIFLTRLPDHDRAGGGNGEDVADLGQAAPFDRLLGRPIQRTELTVTVNSRAVPVARVGTSNPDIRIYRVTEPPPER